MDKVCFEVSLPEATLKSLSIKLTYHISSGTRGVKTWAVKILLFLKGCGSLESSAMQTSSQHLEACLCR